MNSSCLYNYSKEYLIDKEDEQSIKFDLIDFNNNNNIFLNLGNISLYNK